MPSWAKGYIVGLGTMLADVLAVNGITLICYLFGVAWLAPVLSLVVGVTLGYCGLQITRHWAGKE